MDDGNDSTPSKAATRKRRATWLRRAFVALLLLGGAAVIAWAYRPKPVPVEVAAADRGSVEVRVREEGKTRVKDRYVISAPLSGRLLRLGLTVGDPVEQGQVLAQLLPVDAPLSDATARTSASARVHAARAALLQAQAAAERASARLSFAEQDAQRQRELRKQGVVSQRRLDEAELSVSTLKKEVASARFGERVARSEITMAQAAERRVRRAKAGGAAREEAWQLMAPAAGRVLRVLQQSEAVVPPGTPLLEIGDCAALEVVVDLLTSDAVALKPGAAVALERWGGEAPLQGRVRRVEPRANTKLSALGIEEQRVAVVVDITSPRQSWSSLCDGYRVEASVLLETREDVVRVPVGALFRTGTTWAVYRVREGTAQQTAVAPGSRSDVFVEVTEGLEAGDRIILFPSDRVEDGIMVEPLPAP